MRQQFFYTRREQIAGTEESPIYKEYKDSFNVNAVIRSLTMADGSVLVLLNDIHERTTEQPNINPKNNKMNGVTRRRDVYQSEIYMSPADGERFFRVCSIHEESEFKYDDTKEESHESKETCTRSGGSH